MSQPQQSSHRTVQKEKSSIIKLNSIFVSHYETSLTQAGIPFTELAENSPTFLNFVRMALLSSFQNLHQMKKNLSLVISEKEHEYLYWLTAEYNLNEDPKLDTALKSFDDGLLNYLQKIMLDTGYKSSETEKANVIFVSFLSKSLIDETNQLMQHTFSDNQSNKKRKIGDCSQIESSGLPFEEIKLSECSIRLVETSKRNHIYYLCTPHGLRAMKTAANDNPTSEDIQNLDNELEIGSLINYHSFRKSHAKTLYQNKQALLLEWVDGNPLNDIKQFTIPTFFSVAREIVSCLLAMHTNKICHLNLNCDHIMYNSETNSVKIIGFGSSSLFCSKRNYNPKLQEKDLRCISPEQTGRINRDVDHRSDFYSLGVIFYRMLAGRHPFDSPSTTEIVRMHIFDEPMPLHTIDPNIPLPVSDMISKLMEKDVDSRYQSAKGIMYDMDLIISEYKSYDKITLGENDRSKICILPQKLYGRENEYSAMLSAYNKMVSSSSFQLVLAKGSTGMGKSRLVFELNKPAIKNGIFIFGKHDSSVSKPYSALIEAVNMLCDLIALEDEYAIAKYLSLIQVAVGQEGNLLTNAISNLHSIIGDQPETVESYGDEARNRFNYVFIKLIKAISSLSSLVIVLEDLQWIDSASLNLTKALIEASIDNLMIIVTYRDDEINDGHELARLLQSVQSMKFNTTEIKLNNIDRECINRLIVDTFNVAPFDSYLLASFVHKKTQGNPHFIKQIINNLLDKNSISYNPENRKWQWDASIFEDDVETENIHDLLQQKILSLNMHGQQALKIASCLGNPFSLSSLRLIVKSNKGVEDALATGLITQYKADTYCFVHDQVQHAVKSLLPKNSKPIFFYAAKKLWRLLSTDDLQENICVVVNLFENAKDMISKNERYEVAELFLLAGEKAMACAAFKESLNYFESGIDLLDENSWNTHYGFNLKMYHNAIKSAYCVVNYDRMKELIEIIFNNADDALDLVTPYLLLVRMNRDKQMHENAICNASLILDKLSVSIDPNLSIIQVKSLVEGSFETILEMNQIEDRKILSVMEILDTVAYSYYFSGRRDLFASVCSKMIELTMQYGVSKYSCNAFSSFALVLCNTGDKSSSYEFGKLSLKLLEKSKAKEMGPMVQVSFFCLISPLFDPMYSSLAPLRNMTFSSLEIGSHHYCVSCLASYCGIAFFCGEPLWKAIDIISQLEELITLSTFNKSVYQAALNLHDENTESFDQLSKETFDYKYCFDEGNEKNDVARTSLLGCVMAYLFYEYDTASKFMDVCKEYEGYFGNFYHKAIYHFYNGLVTSSKALKVQEKENLIKIVTENILKLEEYASNAPMNYLNKVHLLKAELAVITANLPQAESYYQSAVSLSKEHGFVNEEALACEKFAIFYFSLNLQIDAHKLLVQAYNCYKTWDAKSKMIHLKQRYPYLIAALATFTADKTNVHLEMNDDNEESVSVLTGD